jgi:GNAT superfamily N-acetyltransferase
MLLGYISEHYFGLDLIASDYLWYVAPEHRGSKAGLQLLIAFQDWARKRNAAEVYMGISSGLHAEKTGALLTKLGYDVVGGNYKLRVVK